MLIECLIKRKAGTKVNLGRTTYEFKEDAKRNGAHVCTVTDQKHIQILLGIPEGYREFGKGSDDDEQEQPVPGKSVEEMFPLADLNVDLLSNSQMTTIAQTQMKLSGTNKEAVVTFAKQHFGVDLDRQEGKRTYVELLRDLIGMAIEDNRKERLAYLQEQEDERQAAAGGTV